MNKLHLVLLSAALASVPLALGHSPEGSPKDFCETSADMNLHDYGLLAIGANVGGPVDGSACGDFHKEFAAGAAYLSVDAGDGFQTGSWVCLGEWPHHPYEGTVYAADAHLPTVSFYVGNDFGYSGDHYFCGDGFLDDAILCTGSCTPTFGPGGNGAYVVLIEAPATVGHVWT